MGVQTYGLSQLPHMTVRMNAATQLINSAALTRILLDTVEMDMGSGLFTFTSNTIKINVSGMYLAEAMVQWAIAAANSRQFGRVNNVTSGVIVGQNIGAPTSTVFAIINDFPTRPFPAAAGDVIELLGQQDTGAALNAVGSAQFAGACHLSLMRIGDKLS